MISGIKNQLCTNGLYLLARDVKNCVTSHVQAARAAKVVSLKPAGRSRGNALLSHIIDGFLLKPGQVVPTTHTNIWEGMEIAKIFMDIGFSVDVISYQNTTFLPQKPYQLFLDVRNNLERLAEVIGEGCIKVMQLDTKNILWHDMAEIKRLLDLQERKGVTLFPRRFQLPNRGLEHAHCGLSIGDRYTQETFRYAGKPIYSLPIPASVKMPFPEQKDFEACRNRFLWFGSAGMVQKGLDLVLDAFAEMPECHLTVCGAVHNETDFVQLYRKELFETPNIHTVGWVDIGSRQFKEIVDRCAATILASCTEGASVSSVNCMHAGLVPILSVESGVDTGDFGYVLNTSSVAEIKEIVRRVAQLPPSELARRSRRAWEYANANHTRERFSLVFRETIEKILSIYGR